MHQTPLGRWDDMTHLESQPGRGWKKALLMLGMAGFSALGMAADDERTPLPSAAASRAAIEELKAIFRADYSAATVPGKKAALAAELLSNATKTAKPVDRWAMFSESMRLAADGGDAGLTLKAIETAGGEFAIDEDALLLDALVKLAPKATPQASDELARTALAIAKRASESGSEQPAQRAITLATALANKAKNRELLAEIKGWQQTLKDQEKVSRELEAMESRLKADGDNPETCLEVGKYFCFEVEDWERGLPLLAKGSDTELARLAVADLNAGESRDALLALAEAWQTWAEDERGDLKAGGLQRAVTIYREILPEMEGLERIRIEKLIDDAMQGYAQKGRRVALADLTPESATDIFRGYRSDGTIGVDPYAWRKQPCPKSLTGHITEGAKKPSVIRFRIPSGAKRLVGKAAIVTPLSNPERHPAPAAPQMFEILLDGRTVWRSPPLSKRDDYSDFDIRLRNAKTVELRVSSTSYSYAWTAWLHPEFTY